MHPIRSLFLFMPVAALLAAPTIAYGCSFANQPPLEPRIAPADVRPLRHHERARTSSFASPDWISSRYTLMDSIHPRFTRTPIVAAFAQQQSIKVIAGRPMDGVYTDDPDSTTPCALEGQRVYAATRTIVQETARAIFITLASRRTSGSTTGCKIASTSCDDTVWRTITFSAPIGARQLYATTFADATT